MECERAYQPARTRYDLAPCCPSRDELHPHLDGRCAARRPRLRVGGTSPRGASDPTQSIEPAPVLAKWDDTPAQIVPFIAQRSASTRPVIHMARGRKKAVAEADQPERGSREPPARSDRQQE